jgi:predicted Na+-dependent transporter
MTANINISYSIIIMAPDRFIDHFHQIYIVIFSLLIAVLMGALLEWESIKKIIRSPMPVFIGFIAQYGVMPMVCLLIKFLKSK